MAELTALKKRITTAFKLSGFLIRSEHSTFLAEQLVPFDEKEREKWITTITESVQNQKLESVSVEQRHIEKAINDINRVGLDEGESVFSVINAFDVPRYVYNNQNKKFELSKEPKSVLAKPSLKSGYLRHRYAMLLQKTVRHELFSPVIIEGSAAAEVKKFKLQNVENLLSTSKVDEAVVLGLLTQLTEGKFYIEDPTGCVPLDLSSVRFHSGFFCEGCFVLAEGCYQDGTLKGLGFPPAEPAASSRAFFGTQNSWGGPATKLLKYSQRLMELERTNTEATIVFLSDVRLDIPQVLDKLRLLFVGYDNCPPVAIVMMGAFSAVDKNLYNLKNLFTQLGLMANGCDQLKKETDLILVPSSDDPAAPNILPRPGIPECLVEGLKKHWPRTKLVTNPCRLQYCTQQILICRLDLLAKFCRNTLHFPDTKEIDNHFARTIICQGTLAPIHPIAIPVNWDYDAALSLYPLPDLVVIGDSSQSFNITQHGCAILNTGSFVKSKFSFRVYVPSTKTIEDSEIPDEMTEE